MREEREKLKKERKRGDKETERNERQREMPGREKCQTERNAFFSFPFFFRLPDAYKNNLQ